MRERVNRQITFSHDEYIALREYAWNEARDERQQARWIIREFLIEKGYLIPNKPDSKQDSTPSPTE